MFERSCSVEMNVLVRTTHNHFVAQYEILEYSLWNLEFVYWDFGFLSVGVRFAREIGVLETYN